MTKEEWINKANEYLLLQTGAWENGMSKDYCEGLYENYVEECGDEWTPEEAVDEDLTYWGD